MKYLPEVLLAAAVAWPLGAGFARTLNESAPRFLSWTPWVMVGGVVAALAVGLWQNGRRRR